MHYIASLLWKEREGDRRKPRVCEGAIIGPYIDSETGVLRALAGDHFDLSCMFLSFVFSDFKCMKKIEFTFKHASTLIYSISIYIWYRLIGYIIGFKGIYIYRPTLYISHIS